MPSKPLHKATQHALGQEERWRRRFTDTCFASCHMHGVNPLAWATDVITKLQDGWPMSWLDELFPGKCVNPATTRVVDATDPPG